MSAANGDLRAALDAITNDKVLLKDHLPRLNELGREIPHTIVPQAASHAPTVSGFGVQVLATALSCPSGPAKICKPSSSCLSGPQT